MSRLPADFLARLNASPEQELIAGRFVLEHEVGLGPTGIVYRVHDRATGHILALKVLRRVDPPALSRFASESQALWSLQDPHVVRYVAHGVSEDGEPWVAMEWADGENLGGLLAREQRLRVADVVVLGFRLTHALAAVHAYGLVHRNLKPNNVHLIEGRFERPKLLDFGIGRSTSAPEFTSGVPDFDGRADLYALGTLLFRCLAGRDPFEGKSAIAALAKAILYEPPRVASFRNDVPRDLDELVARLLASDRDARPPSAAAVAQALARVGSL